MFFFGPISEYPGLSEASWPVMRSESGPIGPRSAVIGAQTEEQELEA